MRIVPTNHGEAVAKIIIEDFERRFLAVLFGDVAKLLTSRDADADESADPLERLLRVTHTPRPEDPALLRLLPDVDDTDEDRSRDYRRLVEADLREAKLHNLRMVLAGLDATAIELNAAELRAWLRALTDLRLVLGSRLGINTEADADAAHERYERTLVDTEAQPGSSDQDEAEEADRALLSTYVFTSWMQENLIDIAYAHLPQDPEDT